MHVVHASCVHVCSVPRRSYCRFDGRTCVAGCWVALFPVLLVDLLGIDRIERSLGMCMGVSSFAFLVAAPISGTTGKKPYNNDNWDGREYS